MGANRARDRPGGPSMDGCTSVISSWDARMNNNTEICLTKTDDVFLQDTNLEFMYSADGLNLDDLNALFISVGFPARSLLKLQTAIQHSHKIVWIRSTRKSRFARLGQCVGFARAISDGALCAGVWDVCVHPTWMRMGLGRGLIERIQLGLAEDGINTVALYSEPSAAPMYRKLGFVEAEKYKALGMGFQRRSKNGSRLIREVSASVVAADKAK